MTRIEYLDAKMRLFRLFRAPQEYQLRSRQRALTQRNRYVSISEDSLPALVTDDDENFSESEDSLPALVAISDDDDYLQEYQPFSRQRALAHRYRHVSSSSEDSLPALVAITDDDENDSESEDSLPALVAISDDDDYLCPYNT